MKCPKCGHTMKTTHVYDTGDGGSLKRLTCDCGLVVTAQVLFKVLNVNPSYGEGASALAKKLSQPQDRSSSKGTQS